MIDLYWVVQVNNFICILACVCCFLHALHGGIYTNSIAKLVLFLLGLGFFSSTMTVEQVVMPGYKYILIVNVLIGLFSISWFITEANRFGCLTIWVSKIQHLLFGVTHARHKHR